MPSQRIALDSPAFAGRRREYGRRSTYERRPIAVPTRPQAVHDVVAVVSPKPQSVVEPRLRFAPRPVQRLPAAAEPRQSVVTERQPIQKPKRTKANILMIGMATTLFILGLSVAFIGLSTNKHVAAQVTQVAHAAAASKGSDVPPEETKPTAAAVGSYVVPPTEPRMLMIPKLSVSSRIRKLNITSQGELATPSNVYDTGWYQASAKPGDAGGAILIDGHVHGPTQKGVFYNLKTLVAGDTIQIQRGDNQVYSFKVVKLQSYDADKLDMAAALTSAVPSKLGLNLITCTGPFDQSSGHYEQRLIVFAVAV